LLLILDSRGVAITAKSHGFFCFPQITLINAERCREIIDASAIGRVAKLLPFIFLKCCSNISAKICGQKTGSYGR
jgi:hypothetical protein